LYALKDYKENIFLTNRTIKKGEKVAQEFGVIFVNKNNLPKVDICINVTPIEIINSNAITTFEVMYSKGSLGGKKMLLYQGLQQFKMFTGREAPEKVMAAALN
jgi:shikimate 5-dehydrogenase